MRANRPACSGCLLRTCAKKLCNTANRQLRVETLLPLFSLLQEFSGDFLLTRMKVKAAKVKQDVGLEPLPIPVAVGFFDESLNPVV